MLIVSNRVLQITKSMLKETVSFSLNLTCASGKGGFLNASIVIPLTCNFFLKKKIYHMNQFSKYLSQTVNPVKHLR